MGPAARIGAVVVVTLSVAGGCGKSREDLGIVRSTPGDSGAEHSLHGGPQDAETASSDARASWSHDAAHAETGAPTADARAPSDAATPDILDAGSAADGVSDGGRIVADACAMTSSSTIPGVRIEFPAQPCTFTLAEAAAGIDFHYRMVVDQPIPDLQIPAEPCSCLGPLRQAVSGGGQWYCECDFGCCDQPAGEVYPLASGITDGTSSWNGRNWNGPSDTGQPFGAAFPPGTYGFEVTLSLLRVGDAGIVPIRAAGVLTVTLVP